MNDKKQIEEMAKDVWKASCAGHSIECTKCEYANNSTNEYSCVDFVISQNLYNEDYRKQNEVVWAIFDDIDKIAYRYLNDADYSGGDMIYDLNELKEKYTKGGVK